MEGQGGLTRESGVCAPVLRSGRDFTCKATEKAVEIRALWRKDKIVCEGVNDPFVSYIYICVWKVLR